MSFPGTYNIKYYKGDTFEFRIYPKDNSNAAFSLDGFSSPKFTIAEQSGDYAGREPIEAYASIDSSGFVLCAIRPEDSEQMDPTKTYVYDVEIKRVASPYDYVYTLLSGTVSITEEVTLPSTTPQILSPNAPGSVTLSEITSTSITMNWTAPIGGTAFDGYRVAILSNPLDPTSIIGTPINVASNITTYTFTDLTPSTLYGFGVVTYNDGGDSAPAGTAGSTLIAAPNTPGPLVLSDITSSAVTMTWTAPTGGTAVEQYKVALLSNPLDPTSIIAVDVVDDTVLTYTFTGLNAATTYGFGVVASNAGGDSDPSGNFTTTLGA